MLQKLDLAGVFNTLFYHSFPFAWLPGGSRRSFSAFILSICGIILSDIGVQFAHSLSVDTGLGSTPVRGYQWVGN